MKKVFKLTDEKKHPERIIEAIKHELRKYIKRERSKKLPDTETMFWDFACKFGQNPENAEKMDFNDIIKKLDGVNQAGWSECYVEIIAKAEEKPAKSATPLQHSAQ